MHTASPVSLTSQDERAIIDPAVNGVTFVVRACHQHKVKRVVITSSVAAVSYPLPEDVPDENEYTEANWTNPENRESAPYIRSKALGEKAAWNMQEQWRKDNLF